MKRLSIILVLLIILPLVLGACTHQHTTPEGWTRISVYAGQDFNDPEPPHEYIFTYDGSIQGQVHTSFIFQIGQRNPKVVYVKFLGAYMIQTDSGNQYQISWPEEDIGSNQCSFDFRRLN